MSVTAIDADITKNAKNVAAARGRDTARHVFVATDSDSSKKSRFESARRPSSLSSGDEKTSSSFPRSFSSSSSSSSCGEKSNPSVVTALIARNAGYATNGARFAASEGRYVSRAPMSGPKTNPHETAPHRRISPYVVPNAGVSPRAAARRHIVPVAASASVMVAAHVPSSTNTYAKMTANFLGTNHPKAAYPAPWHTVFQKKMALCLPVTSATYPHAGVATKPTRGRNALTYPISVEVKPHRS